MYHPQSQGKVERANEVIKNKLAKIMAGTKLNWFEALPIALMSIRAAVNRSTGFTPFELHMFPGPWGPIGEGPQKAPKITFATLNRILSVFVPQVIQEDSGEPKGDSTPGPEDKWMLLKVLKRKWQEPRWTGPHRMTARTSIAIQLKGKGKVW